MDPHTFCLCKQRENFHLRLAVGGYFLTLAGCLGQFYNFGGIEYSTYTKNRHFDGIGLGQRPGLGDLLSTKVSGSKLSRCYLILCSQSILKPLWL